MNPMQDIRYIQLETGTACNYKCIYCPVAYSPRRGGFMPLNVVESIANQLKQFPSIESIYLNGYDEPSLNPNLPTIIKTLSQTLSDIDVIFVIFTNATNLSPDYFDRLIETQANLEIDIHLSAIDNDEFERIHQSTLYNRVIKNIDYMITMVSQSDIPIDLAISMQGLDNKVDNLLYSELKTYFASSQLNVSKWLPNDRAGIITREQYAENIYHKVLKGCSLNNRTKEWLHINANGNVILCCQDYFEEHVLGNVSESDIIEILNSKTRKQYHLWTEGIEEAPEDYICRKCHHAIVG